MTDTECAVLIPSCNEPDIAHTIASVGLQTRRPLITVVVLNNCTDDGATRALAEQAGKDYDLSLVILEMEHNDHMKAGALNFGYNWLRQHYSELEYLIQMDADSILDESFIENTTRALRRKRNQTIGALSCTFTGREGLAKSKWQSIVMWFQHFEYVKYHDSGVALNVSVVSGTGCALRIRALEELRKQRNSDDSGNDDDDGDVWATDSLVEDHELTLHLRSMGWETRKSNRFRVYTDLMPSVKSLIKQRTRWQRGTNDELRRFGFRRFTAVEILKQWFHGVGILVNALAWIYIAAMFFAGTMSVAPIIIACIAVIAARHAYHARSLGWKATLFAATLIPDTIYGLVRNYWWLKALALSLGRSKKEWT